jgi:hypothetical protein
LDRNEARRIAPNIAKLPELLQKLRVRAARERRTLTGKFLFSHVVTSVFDFRLGFQILIFKARSTKSP